MRKALLKIWAVVTLLAFVHLICANTLFTHTHRLSAGNVTHSHPYNPYSHHSHSAVAFQLIAQNNLSATSVLSSSAVNIVEKPVAEFTVIEIKPTGGFIGKFFNENTPLRAPPVAA